MLSTAVLSCNILHLQVCGSVGGHVGSNVSTLCTQTFKSRPVIDNLTDSVIIKTASDVADSRQL